VDTGATGMKHTAAILMVLTQILAGCSRFEGCSGVPIGNPADLPAGSATETFEPLNSSTLGRIRDSEVYVVARYWNYLKLAYSRIEIIRRDGKTTVYWQEDERFAETGLWSKVLDETAAETFWSTMDRIDIAGMQPIPRMGKHSFHYIFDLSVGPVNRQILVDVFGATQSEADEQYELLIEAVRYATWPVTRGDSSIFWSN
jgi:hypothetical protein